MKNKVAAGLFGIFLGDFGVHKFYLGQIGAGVLYACFFWTGIPGIIGLVEGILYLTMSDDNFDQKYNNGFSQGDSHSAMDKLEQLTRLRQNDAITSAEYEKRRAELVKMI